MGGVRARDAQLGYTLYDERHPITGGNNTLRALRHAFSYAQSQEGGAVFQSPMATPILHELPRFSGLLVVFIARNCIDVFRSQNKVNRRAGGGRAPPAARRSWASTSARGRASSSTRRSSRRTLTTAT